MLRTGVTLTTIYTLPKVLRGFFNLLVYTAAYHAMHTTVAIKTDQVGDRKSIACLSATWHFGSCRIHMCRFFGTLLNMRSSTPLHRTLVVCMSSPLPWPCKHWICSAERSLKHERHPWFVDFVISKRFNVLVPQNIADEIAQLKKKATDDIVTVESYWLTVVLKTWKLFRETI